MSKENMTNSVFLDHLESGDPEMIKTASEAVNDFTRLRLREDGFLRKIIPPVPISNNELDRQVDTDKPVKVVDKEPNSPAAITVPFGTNPMSRYIRGPRYRVMFARIMTPRFVKDVTELRTYNMDIRQVISDNAIKDMLAEEDTKFIYAVNSCLVGAGQTNPDTGVVQWTGTSLGVTRETLVESTKVMSKTPAHLEPNTALINTITIKDVMKFHRDEAGGDMAQDILVKGFTEKTLLGINFITTIKTDIVPTNTVFYFAEPKFLGKHYTLEDATMFMDKRAFMIEFFAYEEFGASIGNTAAVTRFDWSNGGSY